MPSDEQKSQFEEAQKERLDELSKFVKSSLKVAQEQTTERVISTMISSGLALSNVVEGLANITDAQGKTQAAAFLEKASQALQEDEP